MDESPTPRDLLMDGFGHNTDQTNLTTRWLNYKSPGFKTLSKRDNKYAYNYNINCSGKNTDPFVRKALKQYDKEVYQKLKGFTKKPNLLSGLEDLLKYDAPQVHKKPINSPNRTLKESYELALYRAKTYDFLPFKKLKTVSLSEAAIRLEKNASAGFSFPGQKKKECINKIYDMSAYMRHFIKKDEHIFKPPTKLAFRGHLSLSDDPKVRAIWILPAEVVLLEALWGLPYSDFLKNQVDIIHFGEKSMQKLASHFMKNLDGHTDKKEITLDISEFDKHIPTWLISDAFDILWNSFEQNKNRKKQAKKRKIFEWLKDYFINTPIMLPNGKIICKHHGIPSGSMFTQIIGSICNYLMIYTANFYYRWEMSDPKFLGDDSNFKVPACKFKLSDMIGIKKFFKEVFGATIHEEKIRVVTKQSDKKFLGYQSDGLRFFRPDSTWMKFLLYTERDVDSLNVSTSRLIAFYFLGGCNSQYFSEFFEYYFGVYPKARNLYMKLDPGIKRIFKYVLHTNVFDDRWLCVKKLSIFNAPFVLSCGLTAFN